MKPAIKAHDGSSSVFPLTETRQASQEVWVGFFLECQRLSLLARKRRLALEAQNSGVSESKTPDPCSIPTENSN